MTRNSVESDLLIIREMLARTRLASMGVWRSILLWGILLIIALLAMHLLLWLRQERSIGLVWIIFSVLGTILQILLNLREKRSSGVRTYAQHSISHLGFSCGLAYMATGLIFPLLGVYGFDVIPLIIAVITGILMFTFGGIMESTWARWSGLIWMTCALLMVAIPSPIRSVLFIPLILFTYIVPAQKNIRQVNNSGHA